MGMSVGDGDSDGLMAEINVTPFVDVMLVLLIIFMVTAPMMTSGLEVQLPRAAAPALPQADEQAVVTLTVEGTVHLGTGTDQGQAISKEALAASLKAMAQNKPDQGVFIRADGKVPYEEVARVLAMATAAGIQKVGMVTDPRAPSAGASP
ncbi:MAG: hypothetical protein RL071_3127 [Pseudomonadota bacterium]|jgi:biopolymer transport protein TolR